MVLGEFERLQQLARQASELIIRLKFENRSLKKENESLKEQIQKNDTKVSERLNSKIKSLEEENIRLRQRQQTAAARLHRVLSKVRNLNESVES